MSSLILISPPPPSPGSHDPDREGKRERETGWGWGVSWGGRQKERKRLVYEVREGGKKGDRKKKIANRKRVKGRQTKREKHINGIAMENSLSPVLANSCTQKFESGLLPSVFPPDTIWFRYADDMWQMNRSDFKVIFSADKITSLVLSILKMNGKTQVNYIFSTFFSSL